MLLFFKSFLAIKPNAIFLIITLEDTDRLIAYARSIGIDQNKIFVTQSKRKELPSLLNLCQASVFFIKPAYSKIASSPTKLGELMSMGIPVICNSGVGDTEDLVLEAEAGVVCKSFDETEYKRAAQEFLALYPGFQKQRLRENAIRLFGLENGISNYRKVYQRLMNQE
jgi:glycosyltransferase involved in cell wall biosynthesis